MVNELTMAGMFRCFRAVLAPPLTGRRETETVSRISYSLLVFLLLNANSGVPVFKTQARAAGQEKREAEYLFLCGVMWVKHASVDACKELIGALQSDDPDVILLASDLLAQRIDSA